MIAYKRWLLAGGLVGLLLITLVCTIRNVTAQPRENPQKVREMARTGVGALGTIEPSSRVISISAPGQVGRLAALLVEEGQDVALGSILAYTDEHDLRQAELEKARSEVKIANARLEQTKAGAKPEEVSAQSAVVARAQETLAQRGREFKRSEALHLSQAISASAFEQELSALESARAALKEAESNFNALREVRGVDLRLRESELASAEENALVAQRAFERTQVRAPIAGRVLRIHAHPGERVDERGILDLGDVHRMHVVAEIYEADVSLVQLGMPATARLKSVEVNLTGVVKKIVPMVGRKVALDNDPVSDTDARVVEVRIELNEADSLRVASLTNARVDVLIPLP